MLPSEDSKMHILNSYVDQKGMVIHGCNSSSEAGGLSFQDFPRLHRDKKLNLINFTTLFCQLKDFFLYWEMNRGPWTHNSDGH